MNDWIRVSVTAPLVLAVLCAPVRAQDNQTSPPNDPNEDADTIRLQLPTVIVYAEKRAENVQDVPASVTAVSDQTLRRADIRWVSDAARYAPNVFMNEFSARKLSNPRFRGIGSSPQNPGITTTFDGVPQLNANSSSIELLDVQQIEFVRGPQSALYGRNTVGGLINVTSRRPSHSQWTGEVAAPFGNFDAWDARGAVSGPLTSRLAIGVAAGFTSRNGFTKNIVTGNDLDSRSAAFGKTQVSWLSDAWDARGIVSVERARDGDYALHDLAALRVNPFVAARDFEGSTDRDVVAPTFVLTRRGLRIDLTSTTGLVRWTTRDLTDLDYTPLPLLRRSNAEENVQFTQEVRLASRDSAPIALAERVQMSWQAGVALFSQRYKQDAVNTLAPLLLSPFLAVPVEQHSPDSTLDDLGAGVYGQGTWLIADSIEISGGLRADREAKEARISSFFTPAVAPQRLVETDATFAHVSPQVSARYKIAPRATLYAAVAEGYKAGGFNAASPVGAEAYDTETSWNYEGGFKTVSFGERLILTAAVFRITWHDVQVNLPNPLVPGQFYIANAAGATSTGLELEMTTRAAAGLDVFGSLGVTRARFTEASVSSGLTVGGNTLPYAPTYTANIGADYSRQVSAALTLYARGDVTLYGRYHYDDLNITSQAAYAVTNLRAGGRVGPCFVEGWAHNAFDTRYVPLAFAYPGLAPSGFLGEPGAPRMFGIRAGLRF